MTKKPELTINLPEEIEDNRTIAGEMSRLSLAAWESGAFGNAVIYRNMAEDHREYIKVLEKLLAKKLNKKGVEYAENY